MVGFDEENVFKPSDSYKTKLQTLFFAFLSLTCVNTQSSLAYCQGKSTEEYCDGKPLQNTELPRGQVFLASQVHGKVPTYVCFDAKSLNNNGYADKPELGRFRHSANSGPKSSLGHRANRYADQTSV